MRKAGAAVYGQEPSLQRLPGAEEGAEIAIAPPLFLPNAATPASVATLRRSQATATVRGDRHPRKLQTSQGSILTNLSLSALRSGGCSNCTERAALRRSSSQFGNHMAICGKASTSTTQMTWITMKSAMPR